jgi:four helix bundle protein
MNVTRTNFENLRVYQVAERLGDRVWDVCLGWDFFARDTVGKQLVRSADSIGANIAEGSGRGTLMDHRRFLRTARGSLYETKHWLRRAFRRKLLTPAQVTELKDVVNQLTPMLNAYYRSLETKQHRRGTPDAPNQESKT